MIAAVILAATLVAQAGAPQAAPRDNDTRPTTGTGSISGVVVTDGDQPRPVRRAIVSLTGDGLRPNRGAITDDDGRFAIGNLPAGRFTLTVTRGAFITSVYGAKRPGRQGTPIAVRDGEKVTNITVTIWRGAAISGVVRDDAGALARNGACPGDFRARRQHDRHLHVVEQRRDDERHRRVPHFRPRAWLLRRRGEARRHR